uniref:Uncharacterized protein n=1 Tax=Plectus sambesii TaxID=2011161 RepID=A0A914XQE5_9BILA
MSKKSVTSVSQSEFLVISEVDREGDGDQRKFWREPDWEVIKGNRKRTPWSVSVSQRFPADQPVSTVAINQLQDEVDKEPKYRNNIELKCSGNALCMPLSEMDTHESSTTEEACESSKNRKQRNSAEFRLTNIDDRCKLVSITPTETAMEGGVSAIDLLMNLPQTSQSEFFTTACNDSGRPSTSISFLNRVNRRKQSFPVEPAVEEESPSTSGVRASERLRMIAVKVAIAAKQLSAAKPKPKPKGAQYQRNIRLQQSMNNHRRSCASLARQQRALRRQKRSEKTKQSIGAVISSMVKGVKGAKSDQWRGCDSDERAVDGEGKEEEEVVEQRSHEQQQQHQHRDRELPSSSQEQYAIELPPDQANAERKRTLARERQRRYLQRQRELLKNTPYLAAHRAQEAKRLRLRRAKLRDQLPDDVIAERRRREAERHRLRRKIIRENMTEEMLVEHRRKGAEKTRRRREVLRRKSEAAGKLRKRSSRYLKRMRLELSPEQQQLLRRVVSERRKLIQQNGLLRAATDGSTPLEQRLLETVDDPESAERSSQSSLLVSLPPLEPQILPPNIDPAEVDRLALAAERARLYNHQRRMKMLLTETPEQAAKRRAKECERQRRVREQLNPEQLLAWRQRQSVRAREYYRQLKTTNAVALERYKETLRRYANRKRLRETPEEKARRLARCRESRRRLKERLTPDEIAERRRKKVEQARRRRTIKTGQPPKTPYTPMGTTLKEEIGDCWKPGCDGRTVLTSRRYRQHFHDKVLYCRKCRSSKCLEKKRKLKERPASSASVESSSNCESASKTTRTGEQEESGERRRSSRLQANSADKRRYRCLESSSDEEEEDEEEEEEDEEEEEEDEDDSDQMLPSDNDNQSTSNSRDIEDFQKLSDSSSGNMQSSNWSAWQNVTGASGDQQSGNGSEGRRSSSAVEELATRSSSVETDGRYESR